MGFSALLHKQRGGKRKDTRLSRNPVSSKNARTIGTVLPNGRFLSERLLTPAHV
jgi:hypothetical protein